MTNHNNRLDLCTQWWLRANKHRCRINTIIPSGMEYANEYMSEWRRKRMRYCRMLRRSEHAARFNFFVVALFPDLFPIVHSYNNGERYPEEESANGEKNTHGKTQIERSRDTTQREKKNEGENHRESKRWEPARICVRVDVEEFLFREFAQVRKCVSGCTRIHIVHEYKNEREHTQREQTNS